MPHSHDRLRSQPGVIYLQVGPQRISGHPDSVRAKAFCEFYNHWQNRGMGVQVLVTIHVAEL